jgi:hypothetical protein
MSIRYGNKDHYHEQVQEELKEEFKNGNKYDRVYILKCQYCNSEFFSRNYLTKNCSYRCTNDIGILRRKQRKLQERKKKCLLCGTDFTANRKDTMYCSPKCKQKAYRQTLPL